MSGKVTSINVPDNAKNTNAVKPLRSVAADTATALTLAGMHVITGAAWFIALEPWVKSSQP